jgi:hypothetical protein
VVEVALDILIAMELLALAARAVVLMEVLEQADLMQR